MTTQNVENESVILDGYDFDDRRRINHDDLFEAIPWNVID